MRLNYNIDLVVRSFNLNKPFGWVNFIYKQALLGCLKVSKLNRQTQSRDQKEAKTVWHDSHVTKWGARNEQKMNCALKILKSSDNSFK